MSATVMDIGTALRMARAQVPSLDAQLLLCDLLGVDRAYLFAHPEHPLSAAQQSAYTELIRRRADGEPLDYIRGWTHFYDRTLRVTADVLVPRPETELLIEMALAHADAKPGLTVVDVGTGSGNLAVTFAALRPDAQVYATEVSTAALKVAQANATDHDARVTFLHGDLLTPLIESGQRADLVLANLPYVASADLPDLVVSRWEPALALDGGPDGLDLVRGLLDQVPPAVSPGALLLLEIGADQGAAALALGQAYGQASVHMDYAGLDRILRISTPS